MAIVIKRAEGTVELCTDLSLRAEWERKTAELNDLQVKRGVRLGDGGAPKQLAEEVAELEQAMAHDTLVFRMRAVSRKRWAEAVAAHPPREGDENDEALGTNFPAVVDELLAEPGVIVSVNRKDTGEVVDFDPVVDWPALSEEMSDAQYSEFAQKMFELNRGVIGTPFSKTASRLTGASDKK